MNVMRLWQTIKIKFYSFLGIVISLVAIGIFYLVINFVVVGAQDMRHSSEKAQMKKIEQTLNEWDKEINSYEFKNTIGTITDSEYEAYTRLIDDYNVKVKEYNELAEKVGTTYYVIPGFGKR
jgi:hypothetical protein